MAAAIGACLGVLVCAETQKTDGSIKHFKCAGLSKKYNLEYAKTYFIWTQTGSDCFGGFGACTPSNG